MEQIAAWIQELIVTIGYPGIVLVTAVENVFPPIPSELVLPFAGALSVTGDLNYWATVASGTLGSLIGAAVFYGVGYIAQLAGVRRLVTAYGKFVFISTKDLDRGAAWFERFGEAVIFFGRLVPVVRSIISIPAGYTRMPAGRFLLYTTAGTALWSLLLTYVGRVLGENWADIAVLLKPYESAILVLLILAVAGFIGQRAIRRGR